MKWTHAHEVFFDSQMDLHNQGVRQVKLVLANHFISSYVPSGPARQQIVPRGM